jgi:GT2 family glycosyltransferase
MTAPDSIVFLLVAYGNLTDVEQFVDHVRHVEPSPAIRFAVCDNSQTSGETGLEKRTDVVLVRRPDNPGYLPGGLAALQASTRDHGELPDWAILSNTDLTFENTDLVAVLGDYDPRTPVVLAPRITEGPDRIEKNPHLLQPRSRTRHRVNHYVTLTPWLAFGYLVLSRIRLALRTRRFARGSESRITATAGSTMYSPYGAMIVFSRGFLEREALPPDAPITTEEYVVAEQARREAAPVVFEPRIHVYHDPHTTTGPKVSWPRAVRLSRAFAYIYADAARADR